MFNLRYTLRQEQQRLNFGDKTMQYVFINGVADIIAMRQKEPKIYANNYNVHGATADLQNSNNAKKSKGKLCSFSVKSNLFHRHVLNNIM